MTPAIPAPGTPLREFTVEMLEALPVGAGFLDANDSPGGTDGLSQEWHAITKRHDGLFAYCDEKYGATRLLEWTAPFDYRLIDPETRALPKEEDNDDPDPTIGADTNEAHEALAPFALFCARAIPESEPDDKVLFGEIAGAPVTVGDFRRAAREFGGGR